MKEAELRAIWMEEEKTAHITGWDFSHIHGRYEEENDLPWDYKSIIRQYLQIGRASCRDRVSSPV